MKRGNRFKGWFPCVIFVIVLLFWVGSRYSVGQNVVKIVGYEYLGKVYVDTIVVQDDNMISVDGDLHVWGRIIATAYMNPLNYPVDIDINKVYAPNCATYDSTPTYEESGKTVHPDIVYHPDKWPEHGSYKYHYWMISTPFSYCTIDSCSENPQILASQDGQTWVYPDGSTEILVDSIEGSSYLKHCSDPDLIFGLDDSLWAFWRYSFGSTDEIRVRSSYDGINWSEDIDTIFSSSSVQWNTPAAIIDSDTNGASYYKTYFMYDFRVYYRTATSPRDAWSDTIPCTVSGLPCDSIWNIDVRKFHGKYYMLISLHTAAPRYGQCHLCESEDGDSWTCSSEPFLQRGVSGQWDDNYIYRASFMPFLADGEVKFKVWYSGQDGSDWHIAQTELSLGVEKKTFANFDWATNDGGDSVTVWHADWEADHFYAIKLENESSTDDQIDTIVFSSAVVGDVSECLMDSNCVAVDSFFINLKASSTTSTVAGYKYRVFRQSGWDVSATQVYSSGGTFSSVGSADTWERVGVPYSSFTAHVCSGDRISVHFIATVDTDEYVKVEIPEFTYWSKKPLN